MIKCNKCNCIIEQRNESCPLCGVYLGDFDRKDMNITYPEYNIVTKNREWTIAEKILLVISIILSCTVVFINAVTSSANSSLWSLVVVSSIIFIWVIIRYAILAVAEPFAKRIYYSYIALTLLFVSIAVSGNSFADIAFYMGTSSLIATSFIIIFMLIKQSNWKQYLNHEIKIIFILLLTLSISMFKAINFSYMIVYALVLSLIYVLALFIFIKNQFKDEMARKFHI